MRVHLHFPEVGSLKGKRKELLSVKAQLQRRFGASVAEVDHHDVWQRSRLTLSCVAREYREAERLLVPQDHVVVTRRSRIGDIAHRNKFDDLLLRIAPWVLVHGLLARNNPDEGTHGVAGRKATHRRQADNTAIKHWHLPWLSSAALLVWLLISALAVLTAG